MTARRKRRGSRSALCNYTTYYARDQIDIIGHARYRRCASSVLRVHPERYHVCKAPAAINTASGQGPVGVRGRQWKTDRYPSCPKCSNIRFYSFNTQPPSLPPFFTSDLFKVADFSHFMRYTSALHT